MTVMVTGGAGFIGSHIVRQLAERGDHVVIYDMHPLQGAAAWWLKGCMNRVKVILGAVDLWPQVLEAVQEVKPDAIVHTAAIGDPAKVAKAPTLAIRVNLEGTVNFLEAARLARTNRFIAFSSIGALPGIRYQPVDTAHPVILPDEGPGSGFYGASKVALEAFCFAHRQAYGTDFFVVRPSAVYGFGQQHPIFIKPMVENAVLGKPTRFEHGREFPRDYTHVDDVAQLVLRALEIAPDKVQDRVFYAATGEKLRTAGDVADIVRQQVPSADIQIGSGLSETDLLEIRYRGVLSIENGRRQLGYEPRFANLENGIADYIRNFRQYSQEQRQCVA